MGECPVDEPESVLPPPELVRKQRVNACHEVMEGDNYLLISSSEGEFGVSHHIDPENVAKYIGYLEAVKQELVNRITGAGHDDG